LTRKIESNIAIAPAPTRLRVRLFQKRDRTAKTEKFSFLFKEKNERANKVGTKFGDGGKIGIGKRGRAKIPFPRPFLFLPARAENQKFFLKKVRASE
jgi:hypothetical protein